MRQRENRKVGLTFVDILLYISYSLSGCSLSTIY